MELHLRIIGWLLVGLSLIHIGFPRYFKWKEELRHLSLINRQMMTIHTFFIALVVLLMGMFYITSANQLATTELGKRLSLGFLIFWGCRAVFQFFGYSPVLWKGKKFETTIHIIFSLLWLYICWVFFTICLQ